MIASALNQPLTKKTGPTASVSNKSARLYRFTMPPWSQRAAGTNVSG
jgi:hypothetical protein